MEGGNNTNTPRSTQSKKRKNKSSSKSPQEEVNNARNPRPRLNIEAAQAITTENAVSSNNNNPNFATLDQIEIPMIPHQVRKLFTLTTQIKHFWRNI